MRTLIYFFSSLLIVVCLSSCGTPEGQKEKQTKAGTESAIITFDKSNHNFGTVTEGEKVTYAFRFKNEGNTDLILTSVGTSCGCTASDYPQDPIKPGELGKIQITFNSANRLGMQNKKITIRSNANPEFTVLNIVAKVVEKNSEN